MATVTFAVGTQSTSNTTSYAATAFTPAANDLIVVFVYASATLADDAYLTDTQNLGWSLITTVRGATNVNNLYVFVAQTLAAASSTTVTFHCDSDAATGTDIDIYRVSGMTKTGAFAVRQIASSANIAAASTPAVTFGSAVLTGNPTLGAVGNNSSPAGLTPPASWTEGNDSGYSTPTTGMESVFRSSGFTGTTITWASTTASAGAVVGIELDTGSTKPYLVQQIDGNNTSTTDLTLTLPHAGTTGNVIVVAFTENNNPGIVTSVTDGTNTYTKITGASGQTGGTHNNFMSVYYAYNISGSPTSIVIHKSGGSGAVVAKVREYTGLTTTDPLDKVALTSSSGTAISSGATTTLSQANELVIGFEGDDFGTGQSIKAGTGFADIHNQQAAAGMIAIADEVVAATTAVTFTATLGQSTDNVSSVVTFLVSTSGTLYTQSLTASMTPTGAFTKQAHKPLTGSLPLSGVLAKRTARAFTASMTSVGALTKKTVRALGGSLGLSGVLTGSHLFFKSLTASMTPVGTLTRRAGKALSGSLPLSGVLSKQTKHSFTAAMTPVGALAKKTARSLSGSMTPSGLITGTAHKFTKALTGAMTPVGVLARKTNKALSGSLPLSGVLNKFTSKHLSGSLTPSGVLTTLKAYFRTFTASMTPTGTLTKKTNRSFTATLTFATVFRAFTPPRFKKILRTLTSFSGRGEVDSSKKTATVDSADKIAEVSTSDTIGEATSSSTAGTVQSENSSGIVETTNTNETLD